MICGRRARPLRGERCAGEKNLPVGPAWQRVRRGARAGRPVRGLRKAGAPGWVRRGSSESRGSECWALGRAGEWRSGPESGLAGKKRSRPGGVQASWAEGRGVRGLGLEPSWAGLFWVWASSRVWAPFLFLFLIHTNLTQMNPNLNLNSLKHSNKLNKMCTSMNATTKF